MQVVQVDWTSADPEKLTVVKDLELVSVLPETHPIVFAHDNALNNFDTSGLYGIKDPSEVTLINTYQGSKNQFLRISVNRCAVNCADRQDIDAFLQSHSAATFQALNYVDYEDVVASDGHVKTTLEDLDAVPIPLDDGNPIKLAFIEARIELEDSLW